MATVFDQESWDARLRLGLVLSEIERERLRQDEKWGVQNHPDIDYRHVPSVYIFASQDMKEVCQAAHKAGQDNWATILLEEVLEAVDEAETDGASNDSGAKLRTELIQVAAVCVAWVEAIDRRADG